MWRGTAPSDESVARLAELRRKHDLRPLAVHGCYLTNLAAADPEVQRRSRESFRLEIENARAIGADYLVIHPGSAKGQTRREAIEVFAAALAEVQHGFDWGPLRLLLENTAGGGDTLGRSFEELAELGQAVGALCDAPLGFCIDTAHSFEAGYDIATARGLRDAVRSMNQCLGMENVRLFHANDSKTAARLEPGPSRVHRGRAHRRGSIRSNPEPPETAGQAVHPRDAVHRREPPRERSEAMGAGRRASRRTSRRCPPAGRPGAGSTPGSECCSLPLPHKSKPRR